MYCSEDANSLHIESLSEPSDIESLERMVSSEDEESETDEVSSEGSSRRGVETDWQVEQAIFASYWSSVWRPKGSTVRWEGKRRVQKGHRIL